MREFDLVDPLKIAGHDFYLGFGAADAPDFPGPAGLMDRLVATESEYGLDRVSLSNSGAEAVENAIEICYSAPRGTYGITFEGAFHGRTLGALSLNRSKSIYRAGFSELAGTQEVPFCRDRTCEPEGCGFFVDGPGELTSVLRRALDPDYGYIDPESVAYLIYDPIQGEGGYRFPSDAFAEEIESLRREHEFPYETIEAVGVSAYAGAALLIESDAVLEARCRSTRSKPATPPTSTCSTRRIPSPVPSTSPERWRRS